MSGIKDKVIAITGAGRGIGEATAVLLAERGAKVVLMALSSDQLRAVAGRIADAGGAVAHTTGDRMAEPTSPASTPTGSPANRKKSSRSAATDRSKVEARSAAHDLSLQATRRAGSTAALDPCYFERYAK